MDARIPALVLLCAAAACGGRTTLREIDGDQHPPGTPPVCVTEGDWRATADTSLERSNPVVAALPGGAALLVGGAAGGALERYDSASGQWSGAGALLTPREFGHTATPMADGRVLVVGGLANDQPGVAGCEIFDAAAGGSTATSPLPDGRYAHAAVRLPDGRILVTGGFQFDFGLGSAVLFDPANESWTNIPAPPNVGGSYTASAPHPAGAWVVAYDGIYLFRADTEAFELVGSPPAGTSYIDVPLAAVVGDKLVVLDYSGQLGIGNESQPFQWSTAWTIPPNVASPVPSLLLPRCGAAIALVEDLAYRVPVEGGGPPELIAGPGMARSAGVALSEDTLLAVGGFLPGPDFTPTRRASLFE